MLQLGHFSLKLLPCPSLFQFNLIYSLASVCRHCEARCMTLPWRTRATAKIGVGVGKILGRETVLTPTRLWIIEIESDKSCRCPSGTDAGCVDPSFRGPGRKLIVGLLLCLLVHFINGFLAKCFILFLDFEQEFQNPKVTAIGIYLFSGKSGLFSV